MNFNLPLWFLLIGVGVSVFILFYFWVGRIISIINDKTSNQVDETMKYLDLLFVDMKREKLVLGLWIFSGGSGLIFLILFWPNAVLALIFSLIFIFLSWNLPRMAVKYIYQKRCSQFTAQMVDGMTVLSNGVKAGLSVTQSMDRIVKNLGNPISQEFQLVLSQTQVGVSLEEALEDLAQRIPRPDVRMFVTSVNILKETGGNMAETFQTITSTIRERQKIEKKIEALTAQGVMQGIIISCIPFILMGVFFAIDPNYIKPLFTTSLGLFCLGLVLILQTIGGLAIRKMIQIKV